MNRFSLLGAVIIVELLVVVRTSAFSVLLIHNRGSTSEPFLLEWPAQTDRSYDVLGAPTLGEAWIKLNREPIRAVGGEGRFVDMEIGQSRFYLVVEKVAAGSDGPVEMIAIEPPRANLVPGGTQQFRAILPAGHTAIWSVEALGGTAPGSVNALGFYAVPVQLPEIPVVLLRVRSDRDPSQATFAVITLTSVEALQITREQATVILRDQVIEKLPAREEAIGFGLPKVVDAADVIVPYSPPGLPNSMLGRRYAVIGVTSPEEEFLVLSGTDLRTSVYANIKGRLELGAGNTVAVESPARP